MNLAFRQTYGIKKGYIQPLISPDFWLDAENPQSYSGSGTNWVELVSGINCGLVNMVYNSSTKTINSTALNQHISLTKTLIPEGGYTFNVYLKIKNLNTEVGNAGFWRSVEGPVHFNILNKADLRPWIRQNGTDIMKPITGYQVLMNEYVMLTYVYKAGQYSKFFVNGIEKHSIATTMANVSEIKLVGLGYQLTTQENFWGDYKSFIFYKKPILQAEILDLYNKLTSSYNF